MTARIGWLTAAAVVMVLMYAAGRWGHRRTVADLTRRNSRLRAELSARDARINALEDELNVHWSAVRRAGNTTTSH